MEQRIGLKMEQGIDLKILPEYADEVLRGEKTFEVRLNERDFKSGDVFKFTVVDEDGNWVPHRLNDKKYRIGYVLKDFDGLAPGYVAFSMFPVKEAVLGVLLDDDTNFDVSCTMCNRLSKALYGDPHKGCNKKNCRAAFKSMLKEAFC